MTTTTATAESLTEHAKRLQEIAATLGLPDLGETIVEDTERRLSDSRIRAVVLGEIKQGKSTLINAVLGKDILPTGVTPTTGATVIVREGDRPGAYLDKGDDGRESLDEARFNRLAKGPLTKGATAPDPADDGTLEYEIEGGILPASLELVDTPGINDISAFRASVSRGELPRADILILALDATQLLNRTEMAFLRDAVAAVGGLADSGATLLLAVNRIDLIAERERPRLVQYVEDELGSLDRDGKKAYELYLTDARTACRDPDADTPGVQGVIAIRKRLHELADRRAQVLPLRARAGLVRHASLLGHNASVAARALTFEAKSLRREIERFEDDLASHETDMTSIRSKMSALRDEILEASAERQKEFREQLTASTTEAVRTMSLRRLTGSFAGALHDAYLQFASREAEVLRSALDEMTRKAILAHSEQARRRLYHATLRLGFRGPTIYVDPPGAVLEASLVAVGVAGTAVMYLGSAVTGLVMAIAGPLTTLVLREKSLRNARARALAELPKALDNADEAFRDQVRAVVDKHMSALDEHLQLANVALGEQLRGVLKRAQARLEEIEQGAPKATAEDEDPAQPARREALASLHALERELGGIRSQLDAL